MQDRQLTGQLLIFLLEDKSPELGARLKQRLIHEYDRRGLGLFNEKDYGHSKFSDFLQNVYGDLLALEKRDGSGDMVVSLRSDTARDAQFKPDHLNEQPPIKEDLTRISNDVWRAFANPDPDRKRFLNKNTGSVRHFLNDEQNDARSEVEASADGFVEIDFATAAEQQRWMKEFLEIAKLRPEEKVALEPLICDVYSSEVQKLFCRALGDWGKEWRRFRNKKMIGKIYQWAKQNNIPFKLLRPLVRKTGQSITMASARTVRLSPRQRANKLLELFDDDQVAKLILPVLSAALLIDSNS